MNSLLSGVAAEKQHSALLSRLGQTSVLERVLSKQAMPKNLITANHRRLNDSRSCPAGLQIRARVYAYFLGAQELCGFGHLWKTAFSAFTLTDASVNSW